MDTPGFTRWWAAWPANRKGGYERKGGKTACLKRWVAHHHETQADSIIKHTEWMKTTEAWLKDEGRFIPMPITYLNQMRWDGAEIPEAPAEARRDDTARYLAEQEAHRAAARAEAQRRRAGQ